MSNRPAPTPSPWHVTEGRGFEAEIWHEAPNLAIARAYLDSDAYMMAAAPALLAALEDLLVWANIQDHHSRQAVAVRNNALAAIAKSEGRQS